jgi:hypothetical protein
LSLHNELKPVTSNENNGKAQEAPYIKIGRDLRPFFKINMIPADYSEIRRYAEHPVQYQKKSDYASSRHRIYCQIGIYFSYDILTTSQYFPLENIYVRQNE